MAVVSLDFCFISEDVEWVAPSFVVWIDTYRGFFFDAKPTAKYIKNILLHRFWVGM